jgi:hypothetical protein
MTIKLPVYLLVGWFLLLRGNAQPSNDNLGDGGGYSQIVGHWLRRSQLATAALWFAQVHQSLGFVHRRLSQHSISRVTLLSASGSSSRESQTASNSQSAPQTS